MAIIGYIRVSSKSKLLNINTLKLNNLQKEWINY